jgi:flagellar secretion chaperone FliS
MLNYGQNQYLKTQVATVNNLQLVVLLYEGAIKYLRQAEEGIEEKNIEKRNNNIQRALDIIDELKNALNLSQGGEIARSLLALYLFMNNHLMMANIKNEAGKIQEVCKMLSSLKDAWQAVASQPDLKKHLTESTRPSGIRI